MTAAHVVKGATEPMIRLPALPDLGDLPATIEFLGPWRPGGDGRGDVAVLRLRAPVPVAPARFAPRNALDLPRGLVVLGFPVTADSHARIASVEATTARFLIDGEWVQLQSRTAFGPVVGKGYSGAAVALRTTGEIVGMVTAADRADRLGHMLPVARLLEHWEPLAEVLPLGPLTPAAHAELRRALAQVPVESARTAARRAVEDDLGPEPDPMALANADSAYAIAAYLAEGLYLDSTEPTRVREVLARYCNDLGTMHRAVSPDPLPRPDPTATARLRSQDLVTVCVQVARSGSGQRNVLLGIRLRRGEEPIAEICQEVVSRGRLRARVQEMMPEAITRFVPRNAQVAVEFVLPRGSLSLPVDAWTLGPRSVVQIGWRHPVTVRDLARFQQQAPDWDHDRRWSSLQTARPGDDVVHWIGCRDAVDASKLAATLALHAHRAVLALAAPPAPAASHAALRAAFDSGIPAMLWRREGCPPHCGGDGAAPDCAGSRFRSRMADRMARLVDSGALMELPEALRQLRTEAGETGDEDHHGHAVTLLWDPPRQRSVVPPLRMANAR
jgi:hypothetical protein